MNIARSGKLITQLLSWSSLGSWIVLASPVLANQTTILLGGDLAWPEEVVLSVFDGQKVSHHHPRHAMAEDDNRYPFERLGTLLNEADFTLINLETPMSASAQMDAQTWAPSFRAHPELAKAMKLVGIDAVITANNHALDTGSQGLRDTLNILRQNNLHAVGTGNYLIEAREPIILERSQIKIGVLAYTEPENSLMGYATETKAGVAPLNLKHIQADIEKLRPNVDYVLVSLHWGKTSETETHSKMRAIAHQIIDSGADVIMGHHPHVIQGIELYQGKPILYSLGNLIFSYSRPQWGDNMLVKMTLTKHQIQSLQILPIAGQGDVAQPYLLKGDRAQQLLQQLQQLSQKLNTSIEIQGDQGFLSIPVKSPEQRLRPDLVNREKTP